MKNTKIKKHISNIILIFSGTAIALLFTILINIVTSYILKGDFIINNDLNIITKIILDYFKLDIILLLSYLFSFSIFVLLIHYFIFSRDIYLKEYFINYIHKFILGVIDWIKSVYSVVIITIIFSSILLGLDEGIDMVFLESKYLLFGKYIFEYKLETILFIIIIILIFWGIEKTLKKIWNIKPKKSLFKILKEIE